LPSTHQRLSRRENWTPRLSTKNKNQNANQVDANSTPKDDQCNIHWCILMVVES
jgi:hypothetical protein